MRYPKREVVFQPPFFSSGLLLLEVQKVTYDTKVNCTPHVFQVQKVSWEATYSPNRRSFGRSISYAIFVRFEISSLEFLAVGKLPSAEGPMGLRSPLRLTWTRLADWQTFF